MKRGADDDNHENSRQSGRHFEDSSMVALGRFQEAGGKMTAQNASNVLVSTDWVSQHLSDPAVKIAEVDVDTAAYDQGHVPGAVGWNWTTQLCDTVVRDVAPKGKLEAAAGRFGDRQRHDDCSVRRQQQLVRRLGVLAVEAVRPPGRADHGRRPQEVARGRAGS